MSKSYKRSGLSDSQSNVDAVVKAKTSTTTGQATGSPPTSPPSRRDSLGQASSPGHYKLPSLSPLAGHHVPGRSLIRRCHDLNGPQSLGVRRRASTGGKIPTLIELERLAKQESEGEMEGLFRNASSARGCVGGQTNHHQNVDANPNAHAIAQAHATTYNTRHGVLKQKKAPEPGYYQALGSGQQYFLPGSSRDGTELLEVGLFPHHNLSRHQDQTQGTFRHNPTTSNESEYGVPNNYISLSINEQGQKVTSHYSNVQDVHLDTNSPAPTTHTLTTPPKNHEHQIQNNLENTPIPPDHKIPPPPTVGPHLDQLNMQNVQSRFEKELPPYLYVQMGTLEEEIMYPEAGMWGSHDRPRFPTQNFGRALDSPAALAHGAQSLRPRLEIPPLLSLSGTCNQTHRVDDANRIPVPPLSPPPAALYKNDNDTDTDTETLTSSPRTPSPQHWTEERADLEYLLFQTETHTAGDEMCDSHVKKAWYPVRQGVADASVGVNIEMEVTSLVEMEMVDALVPECGGLEEWVWRG